MVGTGNGLADVDLIKSSHGHQIAGTRLLNLDARQTLEAQQLGNAAPLDRAIIANQSRRLAGPNGAVVDAADHDAA